MPNLWGKLPMKIYLHLLITRVLHIPFVDIVFSIKWQEKVSRLMLCKIWYMLLDINEESLLIDTLW